MKTNLIVSIVGTFLTASVFVPSTVTSPEAPANASSQPVATEVQQGNLVISTVPTNPWILVTDYSYTPRIPPQIDLSVWPQGVPLEAVVRDSNGVCVGRVTNETGTLRFIFVEADLSMCVEPLPGPARIASEG